MEPRKRNDGRDAKQQMRKGVIIMQATINYVCWYAHWALGIGHRWVQCAHNCVHNESFMWKVPQQCSKQIILFHFISVNYHIHTCIHWWTTSASPTDRQTDRQTIGVCVCMWLLLLFCGLNENRIYTQSGWLAADFLLCCFTFGQREELNYELWHTKKGKINANWSQWSCGFFHKK